MGMMIVSLLVFSNSPICCNSFIVQPTTTTITQTTTMRRVRKKTCIKDSNKKKNGSFEQRHIILDAKNGDKDDDIDLDIVKDLIRSSGSSSSSNSDDVVFEKVYVGDGGGLDDLDEATRLEIEEGQPSEWMIMKELLGFNIFTVILAVLIGFFLSMNLILGEGWLGGMIGIPGTGTFEEVSPSLPGTLDLNSPEFRL